MQDRIRISDAFLKINPNTRLGCISCEVDINEKNAALAAEISAISKDISLKYSTSAIREIPANLATRKAYKALGQDPSRYRPSAEALLRRIIQKKGLYQINSLVDVINLVSIKHGFSIGGFDLDQIQGGITLSQGTADDIYEAIGRGRLNINHLPTLRDKLGPFGTPTSDSDRTKITLSSTHFLMTIYDFDSGDGLNACMKDAILLLKKYNQAKELLNWVVNS